MAGVTAIQGVDDTLKKLAADAVAGLSPKPDVTVGPLDRDADDLRLNWFLYRITPNPAYRNMEPPQTGWRTSRGRPPLALQLAVPADRVSRRRRRTGATRSSSPTPRSPPRCRRCTQNGDRRRGSNPSLSPLAKPLVEPLRITLDSLDLESISKLWTATTATAPALGRLRGQPRRRRRARRARRRARRCDVRRLAVAPTHGPAPASRRPAADLLRRRGARRGRGPDGRCGVHARPGSTATRPGPATGTSRPCFPRPRRAPCG